ncbi:hypothetical protein CEQ90_17380 [Lewinellaceae bacterium SD302]|nr:hypothetical protein CEQ90_17380 [Lewinellaceae bacterium SD302]
MKYLFALLSALFLFSSCGPRLSPFTQRLYEEQNWNKDDLSRIQYYLSEDLVLTRELRDGKSEIRNGQIKIVDGREVEQIVFKRNTPGVFVFAPKEGRLAVSFESNDENYLIFGANPKSGNRYTLLAGEWSRNGRYGKVQYGGREWRVSTSDAYASILVPLKRERNRNTNGRVVGGRKVD